MEFSHLLFKSIHGGQIASAPISKLNDSLFVVWETGSGSNTAYGNYLEAESDLDALGALYEDSTSMSTLTFAAILDTFASNREDLAIITSDGADPLYPPPFCYFVNEDGIYRICEDEYRVSENGSFLLIYPVGKEDLVNEWNGEIGEFGELSVKKIKSSQSSENISERDENYFEQCTGSYDGGKKRIKVTWYDDAYAFSVNDPQVESYMLGTMKVLSYHKRKYLEFGLEIPGILPYHYQAISEIG